MIAASFHRQRSACFASFAIFIIYSALHEVTTSKPTFQNANTAKAFTKANREFTLSLLKQLPSKSNVFFSPFSISTALAMVHLGARAKTLEEMNQVLHFSTLGKDIYSAYSTYLRYLSAETETNTLETANRIYKSIRFTEEKSFLQSSVRYFNATVDSVDFFKSEMSRMKINSWVSQQTHNKIKNLIPAGALNSRTLMVLVNAIYFKGIWNSTFKAEHTTKMEFRNGKSKIMTDMMYQKEYFKICHVSNLNLDVLELPYVGKTISMVIFLPTEVNGLESVEKSLTEIVLKNVISCLRKKEVKVYLPKFKLESAFQLKTHLSAMGMPSAFDPNKANFSGIYKYQDAYISEVFHKAFVEVNEEGTEASASTGVVVTSKSARIPLQFRADHPFLFFIRDNVNDVMLFAGRFNGPVSV